MARRTQEQRNADAQVRLRRLGLEAGPSKGAEYRLRVALGKARGLSAAQAYGKPKASEAKASVLKAAGRLPNAPRSTWKVPRAPKLRDLGGGRRQVTTMSMDTFMRELRRAAREGKSVELRITADKGQGPRTHIIDGRGGQRDVLYSGGGAVAAGDVEAPTITGKPIMIVGDPSSLSRGGIPAADLLDYFDEYEGDWWDALADLWDSEYGQPG